jgi:uncharacterized membrane protein YbhN (UPF0104 family)
MSVRESARFAFRFGVSFLLLAFLLRQVDAADVATRLGSLSAGSVSLVASLLLAQALAGALRWWVVIGLFDSGVDFFTALRLLYIGLFFNQTLPSSIGGDAVRVWMLHREGLPSADALFSVALDRLAALIGLVLIVAASLPLLFAVVPDSAARWALAVPMGLVTAGTIGLLTIRGRLAEWLGRHRATRPLAALAADARRLFLKPATGAAAAGLSLVIQGLTVACVFVLALALGVQVSFVECLVLVPPVILLLAVPISFAGWGVRETAMVVAFGYAGVPQPEAVAVSIAVGVSAMVFALPGGLVWLLSRAPEATPAARTDGTTVAAAKLRSGE